MMTTTRAEHLQWCKDRALEYLPADPQQAVTSMVSDLHKHPETEGLYTFAGLMALALAAEGITEAKARMFIVGFR